MMSCFRWPQGPLPLGLPMLVCFMETSPSTNTFSTLINNNNNNNSHKHNRNPVVVVVTVLERAATATIGIWDD